MDSDISKETLAAFIDRELPPKEMERIAAFLAERPDLQSYVSRQDRLQMQLQAAFAPVLQESPPARLMQAARAAPASLRWRLRQALRSTSSWKVLAPASATLAVGLVIGVLLRPGADLTNNTAGQLVARGSLSRALEHQLAAQNAAGSKLRIGISFRDRAGEDCRTFMDGASSGLACYRGGSWVVSTLVNEASENPDSAYRMAGSEMPQAVRDAVTASIAGTAFDAQAERAARDSGWK